MFNMQVSLKSSIPQYIKEVYDSGKFEEQILEEIEEEARDKWVSLARESLGSTADDYIDGIDTQIKGKSVVLQLDGTLALMQENGTPKFDMKPGLLKNSKNGYTDVPISSSKPKSGGPNEMPKNIYAKAKHLHFGDRLSDRTRLKSSKVMPYKHATSLYSGMMKSDRAHAKKTGAGYFTIRRVSKNSDPYSWWHPGFQPLNLADKVKEYLEMSFDGIVNKVVIRNRWDK